MKKKGNLYNFRILGVILIFENLWDFDIFM